MNRPLYVKIKEEDNVAIAVRDIPAGTQVVEGVYASRDIPQAHKIAQVVVNLQKPAFPAVAGDGYVIGVDKDVQAFPAWADFGVGNQIFYDFPRLRDQDPGSIEHAVQIDAVKRLTVKLIADPPRQAFGYALKGALKGSPGFPHASFGGLGKAG